MATEEDRLDAEIAKMFDATVETHVTRSGKVVSQRTLLDEALRGDEMRDLCEKLVSALKKFERWDSDPRKYYDKWVNIEWWHAMNKLAECERKVWRLFVGSHPSLADNMQYAQWRKAYLAGKNVKVDA